ncbi:Mov34/MPN/PAD-1 family protein [Demequina sp.]|uniref:Mov34/MPN/PAD-1 family protein n=1 Tax=Demequina sp. TaxID=2050685 RepID=UPI003D098AC8
MVSSRRGLDISHDVATEIKAAAVGAVPNETGGILLGWRAGSDVIVVGFAEIPPRDVRRAAYVLDARAANGALEKFRRQAHDSRVGYVGSWHSHPLNLPPSATDHATFRRAAQSTSAPLAFIVAVVNGESASLRKFWVGRRCRSARDRRMCDLNARAIDVESV